MLPLRRDENWMGRIADAQARSADGAAGHTGPAADAARNVVHRRSLISVLGAMTNPRFFLSYGGRKMKLAESWRCHMTCLLCLPARVQAMALHAVVQEDSEVIRAQVEPGPVITWRFQQVMALKTETFLASLRVTSAQPKEDALLQQQHHAHTD